MSTGLKSAVQSTRAILAEVWRVTALTAFWCGVIALGATWVWRVDPLNGNLAAYLAAGCLIWLAGLTVYVIQAGGRLAKQADEIEAMVGNGTRANQDDYRLLSNRLTKVEKHQPDTLLQLHTREFR